MTWFRRKPPAQASPPAPGHTPVPGAAPASAAPCPPWGPAPAPGPAREVVHPPPPAPGLPRRHGGVDYSLRVWKCGRMRLWDGNGDLLSAHECRCPTGADWHDWEQELAQ